MSQTCEEAHIVSLPFSWHIEDTPNILVSLLFHTFLGNMYAFILQQMKLATLPGNERKNTYSRMEKTSSGFMLLRPRQARLQALVKMSRFHYITARQGRKTSALSEELLFA